MGRKVHPYIYPTLVSGWTREDWLPTSPFALWNNASTQMHSEFCPFTSHPDAWLRHDIWRPWLPWYPAILALFLSSWLSKLGKESSRLSVWLLITWMSLTFHLLTWQQKSPEKSLPHLWLSWRHSSLPFCFKCIHLINLTSLTNWKNSYPFSLGVRTHCDHDFKIFEIWFLCWSAHSCLPPNREDVQNSDGASVKFTGCRVCILPVVFPWAREFQVCLIFWNAWEE